MLRFTGDGEDQVEHLVTVENIVCITDTLIFILSTVFFPATVSLYIIWKCSLKETLMMNIVVKWWHPGINKYTQRNTHTPFHAQQSPQTQSSPPPQVVRVCRRGPGQSGRSWTCGDWRAAASQNELLIEQLHWEHKKRRQSAHTSLHGN